MRPQILLAPLALLLVAGSGVGTLAVTAQDGGVPPPNHPCVGSWSFAVNLGPDLPPAPVLVTLAAGGTALGSFPIPRPGVPFGVESDAELFAESGMHGAWEEAGDRSCAMTVRYFTSSVEGELVVTTTLSAALEVDAAGDELSADVTLVNVDASGENVGSVPVSATGTRITVEPLATDAPNAATPSAGSGPRTG